MKCNSCHTHLPELKRFQKRVCPNCGNPITGTFKPVQPKITPSIEQNDDWYTKAEAARDGILRLMLRGVLVGIILGISSFWVTQTSNYFAVALVLISVLASPILFTLFIIMLVRFIRIRRHLPTNKRPGFTAIVLLFLFGFLTAVLPTVMISGIQDNIQYKENQHRFVEIEATISNIVVTKDDEGSTDHDVYISYCYDGVNYYHVEYPKYKSSMDVGDKLSVLIDPEDPGSLPSDGTNTIIASSVFLTIMLLILIFGYIRPIVQRQKQRRTS